MGSCISPVISNILMEPLDCKAISTFHTPPTLLNRYVDGTFCMIKKDGVIYAYEFVLGLHVFRQTGPPRQIDWLALPPVYHMKMETSR